MRASHTSAITLALLGLLLAAVLGVALALVLTPAGAATVKRDGCGRFKSASVYEKAKVIAIRGVDCGEARRVAKKYDHKAVAKGNWKVRTRPRRTPPVLVRARRLERQPRRLQARVRRQGRRQPELALTLLRALGNRGRLGGGGRRRRRPRGRPRRPRPGSGGGRNRQG